MKRLWVKRESRHTEPPYDVFWCELDEQEGVPAWGRAVYLIPAAQWEELGRLVKHSVMLGESPLGSIAKNSREYPNSIEAVMKLVLQIGGAEDGNESKE